MKVSLAVSDTDLPINIMSGWTRYILSMRKDLSYTDYTTLGLDANGVYVSVYNVYKNPTINHGHTVVAIPKCGSGGIYSGGFASGQETLLAPITANEIVTVCLQPAVNFDPNPSGGYAWVIGKAPPEGTGAAYRGGEIKYRRIRWVGGVPDWADSSWHGIPETSPPATSYRSYFDLDNTAHPDPIYGPHSIDLTFPSTRPMMAVIRNNCLWTCMKVGLDGTDGVYNGDETGATVDRSAIQWIRVQLDSNGDPMATQSGRVFDSSEMHPWYYMFASLAVNMFNDVAIGFSGVKATTEGYFSAFMTWRRSDGYSPVQPTMLRQGTVAGLGIRWGDYSATTLDPTDGVTFWTVQQYSDKVLVWGSLHDYWTTFITETHLQP